MKLLPVFILVVIFLLWARGTRTHFLFFGWAFIVTGFPLLRGQLGPVPVYVFDVAAVLVWTLVLSRSTLANPAWPKTEPPWAPLFLLILGVFGTLIPMLKYGGIFPEMIWNFGHTGLALTTLVLGAFLITNATEEEREGFRVGLASGLAVLAMIAALQKSSESMNTLFLQIFYGADSDTSGVAANTVMMGEILSSGGRVAGPFGSPNTFGVVALFASLNYWLLSISANRKSLLDQSVFGSLVIILFACSSRQALIAGALVVLGFLLNVPLNKALQRILIGCILIAIALLFVDAGVYLDRLTMLSAGAEESNVAARLSAGPERFLDMLEWDSTLLFTGVGLEIQKLARLGVDVDFEILYGFSSNGFLLYLYYFGVICFLIFLVFWIWVAWQGVTAPKNIRRVTMGGGVALVFIVFADNHAVLAEELVTQMMVFVGVMTSIKAISSACSVDVGYKSRWPQSKFKGRRHAHRDSQ